MEFKLYQALKEFTLKVFSPHISDSDVDQCNRLTFLALRIPELCRQIVPGFKIFSKLHMIR